MRTATQERFLVRIHTSIAFHEFVHEGTREEAEERALDCVCPNDDDIVPPFVLFIQRITLH